MIIKQVRVLLSSVAPQLKRVAFEPFGSEERVDFRVVKRAVPLRSELRRMPSNVIPDFCMTRSEAWLAGWQRASMRFR